MEGVTDSANFNLLDELARLVAAKLSQGDPGPLASKQWVVSSSLTRDAMKLFLFGKAVSPARRLFTLFIVYLLWMYSKRTAKLLSSAFT